MPVRKLPKGSGNILRSFIRGDRSDVPMFRFLSFHSSGPRDGSTGTPGQMTYFSVMAFCCGLGPFLRLALRKLCLLWRRRFVLLVINRSPLVNVFNRINRSDIPHSRLLRVVTALSELRIVASGHSVVSKLVEYCQSSWNGVRADAVLLALTE